MNYIERRVFGYLAPNFEKLVDYGFESCDGGLLYRTSILDGNMRLTVVIGAGGEISSEIRDAETDDEYTLHTVVDACGEFVGKVRTQYENVLSDIAEKCFYRKVFKDAQVEEILVFARSQWGTEAEFLWDDTPDCCILRRADTGKWYAAILTAKAEKLGLNGGDFAQGGGKAVLLDIRAVPEEIDKIIDGARYLRAYHLNKKHWLTIPLNGAVPTAEIFERIEKSYDLAKKK